MYKHHKVVFSGSALATVVGIYYSIAGQNMPVRISAGLALFLIGVAVFNMWRESDNRACAADDQIALLLRQNEELTHPTIQVMVDNVILVKEKNLNVAGKWIWEVMFTLRVVPPLYRPMALSPLCEVAITYVDNLNEPLIRTNIDRYYQDGNYIRSLPVDVAESTVFLCEASVNGTAWGSEPPAALMATITIVDARSEWRESFQIRLQRDLPSQQTRWIGS